MSITLSLQSHIQTDTLVYIGNTIDDITLENIIDSFALLNIIAQFINVLFAFNLVK